MRKILALLPALFLAPHLSFAATLLETNNSILSLDSYFRLDTLSYKNVVGLDSANRDDHTVYFGIDYSLAFKFQAKEKGPTYFFKFERNGPGDYSAPLFIHKKLINAGGSIDPYRSDELLPELEEFWLDLPLKQDLGFKAGLYAHEIANGFSLNGSYENYGFTLYGDYRDISWRFYYCRPEYFYKNRFSPQIHQEKDQGYYYSHNASNFFSLDAKVGKGESFLWPYLGVLADYTSFGKRYNLFSTPVKRDLLGTFGIGAGIKKDNFIIRMEAARNFGMAQPSEENYKEITHAGYLAFADVGYVFGKVTPSLQFLLASGNQASLDDALNEATTITDSKNTAFSSYSPLNLNMDDSIAAANCDDRPIVAMGSGCSQNVGVPRPGTLASSDYENLIMPSLGFDFGLTKKLKFNLHNYYMLSFSRPVGTLQGAAKYLSREIGYEVDTMCDYRLNKNTVLSFLAGWFLPGKYYKERRDDSAGNLLSPYLRGDGKANSAYQWEISMEFQF